MGLEETIQLLSEQINEIARKRGVSVSTAESCTGGAISAALANVSKASEYLRGGVVSYTEKVKHDVLKVSSHTLEEHGVVSRECAKEMAIGVQRLTHADFCVSITGYAGETGGDKFAKKGDVYICVFSYLSDSAEFVIKKIQVEGTRKENLRFLVKCALTMLLQSIRNMRFDD